MKVTHENMMGFVLESLGVELASSVEDKAIWKDVDGNQISQDIEISNNHRVVSSHIRYGETVSLELNGFGITRGSSVQITIVFDSPVLSALRINPEGLRFSMTAKGDSIETPSFKIPLNWYDESKETYEYGSTQDLPPHTYVPINERLRISAKVLVDGDRSELDASNHLVPVTYRRNYEELIGLFKIENREDQRTNPPSKDLVDNYENHFISLNTTGMVDLVEGFLDFMKGDFSDTTEISRRIETDARRLWELAISQSKGGYYDDRPLYWARNKMQVALKRHPLFKKDVNLQTSEVEQKSHDCGPPRVQDLFCLIRQFEELSRNYTGVDFSNAKVDKDIETAAKDTLKDAKEQLADLEADVNSPQTEIDNAQAELDEAEKEMNRVENPIKVLVTGFDPFFMNEFDHPVLNDYSNILQSNPSGCVALNLDDRSLGYGFIQTMIFPVRYHDFDNTWNHKEGLGEGVVERYIRPMLDKKLNERADIVVTVSQAGPDDYNVDVFATSTRGGGNDNLDFVRKRLSRSLPRVPETIATNLPGSFVSEPSEAKFYGKYFITLAEQIRYDYELDDSPHDSEPNSGIPQDQIYYGPGGNYLSNEIFFRVAWLREQLNQELLESEKLISGHYHIAKLQNEERDDNFQLEDTEELLNKVLTTLKTGIKGVAHED